MSEFYSIIFNEKERDTKKLASAIFSLLGTKENKYEVIYKNLLFCFLGDKKEYEDNIFEDENVLVVLVGYLLHNKIDYKINIAKQIFHLWHLHRIDLIKELSGTFNVIIFEKDKQKLTVFNDRLGIKPFYYYQDDDKFISASDIKTIALSNQIKKEINWRAWGDIFNYGFIIGDETPFKTVLSLPMSSVLTYEKGNLEVNKYWYFNDIKINYEQSEKKIIERGTEIFKAISKKYEKFIDNHVELPLSGGYDSRCIACCLKYFSNIKFETITSDLHGTGKKDAQIAKELAGKLKVENRLVSDENLYKKYFVEMVYLVNGMTYEHLWAISLRNNHKKESVSFDGMAADVLLTGRRSIRIHDADTKIYSDMDLVDFFIKSKLVGSQKLVQFFSKEALKEMTVDPSLSLNQIKNLQDSRHKLTFLFLNNRIRNSNAIGSNRIIGDNKKVCFFFLDNEFLEFSLEISPKHKIKRDIYLKMLRKAFPEIMKIHTTNDYPFLYDFKKKFLYSLKNFLSNEKLIKTAKMAGINLTKFKKFESLNKISAFPTTKNDIVYLLNLIKRLDFPPELNKDLLFEQVEKEILKGGKIDHILIPITNFVVWYNLFYLGKSLDYLKSI